MQSYLNKDTLEWWGLAQHNRANFDNKVHQLVALAAWLHAEIFTHGVEATDLLHQQVKRTVGNDARPSVKHRHTGCHLLAVVKDVYHPRRNRCRQSPKHTSDSTSLMQRRSDQIRVDGLLISFRI